MLDTLFALPFWLLCALGLMVVLGMRQGAPKALRLLRAPALALFIAVAFIGAPAFSNYLIQRIEQQTTPRVVTDADRHPDNLIVVLTAGWYRWNGSHPEPKFSEDGWERLDAGVKLWKRIGGTVLIAGAPAPGLSNDSIAAHMAETAMEFGIPAAAVMAEGRSRNTFENFTFSRDLLERHRDHLWVVTSALHLPRAMAVAHKLGLKPTPFPCFYRADIPTPWSDWLPSNEGPSDMIDPVHELLGTAVYRTRGWID